MLSYKIKNEVNNIIQAFNNAEYLIQTLNNIDNFFPQFNESFKEVLNSGNTAVGTVQKLNKELIGVKQRAVNISPRKLFSNIDNLQNNLNNLNNLNFDYLDELNNINKMIDVFSITYEDYIKDYSVLKVVKLMEDARTLLFSINGFIKGLEIIHINFEEIKPEWGDGKEMSLVLLNCTDLEDYISKLKFLNSSYLEIMQLLSLSTVDYPIRIIKLESEVFFAKIFGHSKVIGLLTDSIRETAKYIYRNYTTEGKLNEIPRKIEVVEQIIHLRENMKGLGIDVEGMEEQITKSSLAISKDLEALISGESKIKINDNYISMEEENKLMMLERKKQFQLENKIKKDDE